MVIEKREGRSQQSASERESAERELAEKLAQLTPEQAELFARALRLAMRKRRVLLMGYASAAVALLTGLVWALYIYGKTLGSGQFMGWVFLVPLALAAILLITFGRISRGLRD